MKLIKLSFILFLIVFEILPFKSFSQEKILKQEISITLKNETLKSAIKRIENETGITFAYSNLNDLNKKVSGEFIEQLLNNVLSTLFEGTNISFKEIAGKITLFETNKHPKKAKRITVHGYITDAESGESLINANVFNPENYLGTISNNYGFYSYSTNTGKLQLAITYMGYKTCAIDLELTSDTTINIALQPKSDELEEITVIGDQTNQIENPQMSMIDLPIQKLEKIPVILGEADVLKVIQLLPGVQAGVEGTSGIYVRGGGPDQNLFLLDGVPVYNPSHILGIFSTFNPEALKSVKLYKGAFPARFGGRLSSVVDISMKDGNIKELKGDFSIGLIASKLTLEGPIKKDKTSFMFSARRTYIDVLGKPTIAIINHTNNDTDVGAGAYFHDFNLKLNHIFSEKSRLYFSGYNGKDHGMVETKSYNAWSSVNGNKDATTEWINRLNIDWGNTIASLRWNYMFSPKLFANTTATYSNYFFDTKASEITNQLKTNKSDEYAFMYKSRIKDLTAKIDFDYFPSPKHSVKFGINAIHHYFKPGVTGIKNSIATNNILSDTIYGNRDIYANEVNAYIEDDFSLVPRLKINAGLHVSSVFVDNEIYLNPQPRISFRFKAKENLSLKASYSRMTQNVHLLYNSGINLPTDIWVPVTKRFEPPVSDQIAVGSAMNLNKGYKITIEGFYKKMVNLIEYKDGASFLNGGTNWEDKVEKGMGWSYGAELLFEKTIGNTTGWIGYTLSKSERQFDNINFGKVFPAKYDRRHDISIVVTHKFNDHFDIGGTWVFSTGNTATVSFSQYPVTPIAYDDRTRFINEKIRIFEGRNNFRLPSYHRLDLGANFHKKKKNGIRTWSFSIYNAYSHANPFIIAWRDDPNDPITISGNTGSGYYTLHTYRQKLAIVSILPIVPSVTYSFNF